MPQVPAFYDCVLPNGKAAPNQLDYNKIALVSRGGLNNSLNNTAPAVIKAGQGRIGKVIVVAPGSGSGAFTINDAATTGAAAASNVVWSLPYNSTLNVAGQVFDVDFPCANGITLSAVPGAGSPILAISFT